MELLDNRLVCGYFEQLLNLESHKRGYSRVVQEGTRTSKVSKGGINQNLAFYTASFRCASNICSGIQSHTESGVSMVLSKTPIRRSWFQVRLHIEMMVSAMVGTHFPEI